MQDFYINTKILCSSPPLYPWPTKAPPGPLSHFPPPISPNQSSPLDPTHPKPTYTTFPLVIRHPSTTAPLWTLIPLPHCHLTLPDPQRPPPCSVPDKKRRNPRFAM
jgi:hypothetical protein